jgi:hypothetical protein
MEMSPPTSEANGEGNEIIFIFFRRGGRLFVLQKERKTKGTALRVQSYSDGIAIPHPLPGVSSIKLSLAEK